MTPVKGQQGEKALEISEVWPKATYEAMAPSNIQRQQEREVTVPSHTQQQPIEIREKGRGTYGSAWIF